MFIDITKRIERLSILGTEQTKTGNKELLFDIAKQKKSILIDLICSYGSGTIAGFINNSKYTEIEKAIEKALFYILHATDEQLNSISIDNESISKLIAHCYQEQEQENRRIKQ